LNKQGARGNGIGRGLEDMYKQGARGNCTGRARGHWTDMGLEASEQAGG
jgi:hypothetical protein